MVDKLNILIPSTLKKQLIDDHECITHLGKVNLLINFMCPVYFSGSLCLVGVIHFKLIVILHSKVMTVVSFITL